MDQSQLALFLYAQIQKDRSSQISALYSIDSVVLNLAKYQFGHYYNLTEN